MAPALFWEKRTRGVQRLINFAWFLEATRPLLFSVSLLVLPLVLLGRRMAWPSAWFWAIGAGLALAAVSAGWRNASRHFVSPAGARTELESALGLHSRLSAAAAGIGAWPEAARWRPALWHWRWSKLLALPLCALLLVAAACLWPIPPAVGVKPPPIVKPPALAEVESLLEQLEQAPQIDPESLETVRQEADQLAQQDPSDWYSHASLEAAAQLEAKIASGMKSLNDEVSKLSKLFGQTPAEAGAQWNNQLQSALSALQGNVPGLSRRLQQQLSELDASKFKTLTDEQLQELRDQLKQAGKCTNPGSKLGSGKGPGQGEGEETEESDGEGLGNGGVDRGPGTGPLKLGPNEADVGSTKEEALGSTDFSHAALGDALGTTAGQHEVDKKSEHRAASGGTAAEGDGSGAVWRSQNVTPEERKRLQEFFK